MGGMAISNTPRFGFKKYSSGQDKHPDREEYNAHIALLEENAAMQGQGPSSARPKAGKQGRLFKDTTAKRFYWDDGSAWDEIGTNGAGGPASAIVPGQAATEGSSDRSARADHTHLLPLATGSADGAMSKADKTKLDQSTSAATAGRLVLRDGSGRISVGVPTANDHATTKAYVDGEVTAARKHATDSVTAIPLATADVDGLMRRSDRQALISANSATTENTLVKRSDAGYFQVLTPTVHSHAANKGYVDSIAETRSKLGHTHDAADINSGVLAPARLPPATPSMHGTLSAADKALLDTASSTPTSHGLVKRDGAGRFHVTDPGSGPLDAANKKYVDNLVNARVEYMGYLASQNLNEILVPGVYYQSGDTPVNPDNGYPVKGRAGVLVVQQFANGGNFRLQEYTEWNTGRRWIRGTIDGGATWRPWIEQATTAQATANSDGLMSAADKYKLDRSSSGVTPSALVHRDSQGDAAFRRIVLAETEGNTSAARKDYVDNKVATRAPLAHTHSGADITIQSLTAKDDFNALTTPGLYHGYQQANWEELHYPINFAGLLEVFAIGSRFVYQRYTTYRGVDRIFYRECFENIWGDWRELSITGHKHSGSDITSGTIDPARIANATASRDGLMPQSDKALLDTATASSIGGALVRRAENGHISFPDPSAETHAVNLRYLTVALRGKAAASHSHGAEDLPTVSANGPGMMTSEDKRKLDSANTTAIAGSLVIRNDAGQFAVGTATHPTHPTPKSYVDSALATKAPLSHSHGAGDLPSVTQNAEGLMSAADKKKLDNASMNNTSGVLVMRDGNGNINAAAPTGASHVATKSYVDTAVNRKADSGHKHSVNDLTPGMLEMTHLRLTNATDASETSTGHAFQIGDDAGTNIAIDNNEIIGRVNGELGLISMPGGLWGLPMPASGSTATNKDYVDQQVATRAASSHNHSGNQITSGTINPARIANATASRDGLMNKSDKAKLDAATYLNKPGTVVMRHSTAGTIHVETGTAATDAVNKGYVDGVVKPLQDEAVEHFTGDGVIAGVVKPAGVPWKHFFGPVLTSTGGGGDSRTVAAATDENGFGGLWFGYNGLPKFKGILGMQMTTKSVDAPYLTTIAAVDVNTTRIKYRVWRQDGSGPANVFGNMMIWVDIWGW